MGYITSNNETEEHHNFTTCNNSCRYRNILNPLGYNRIVVPWHLPQWQSKTKTVKICPKRIWQI